MKTGTSKNASKSADLKDKSFYCLSRRNLKMETYDLFSMGSKAPQKVSSNEFSNGNELMKTLKLYETLV